MLQLKRPLVGHQVQEFISKLGLDIVLKTHRAETSHLSFIQGKQIVSDNYPLIQKDNILGVICISREFQKMESKNRQLRKKLAGSSHRARYTFSDIKGEHSSILKSIEIAKRIAKNDLTILITGESGTGKELFAQSIHNESSRKTFPFLALNCSSISENLLESELFGYEEGAFTGARRNGKRGLLELAEGGTLFLDEIGDMPYPMQAKFLRVLNERQFMRIGGHEVIDFDVRIIAATNKNLRNMILEHEFRKDLFYRLNVFPLELPSLNNRKSDIPLLVQNFLTNKPQKKTVQPDVYQDLMNFYWDGNIRELKNCVDYMYEVSESSTITKNHLPEYIKEKTFLNEKNRFLEEETTIALRSRQEQKQLIFRFIVKMRQTNQRLSREIISQMCQSQGLFLSMSEIRAILSTLEEDGLIVVTTGRNGIKVTEKGWEKATL